MAMSNSCVTSVTGLQDGEQFRVIAGELSLSQNSKDAFFEQTPLEDGLVLILATEGNEVLKHRASFDCELSVEKSS